jgi:hypothetical protein
MSSFEFFCRMVMLEPTVNVSKSCYQLVVDTNGGNTMCWFFTFVNRSNNVMKNMLAGKPTSVKKWRGRWLIIR